MNRRYFVLGIGGLLTLVTLSGCVIDGSDRGVHAAIETQTGAVYDPDSTKEGALGLIFGMPQIDDRLDVAAGDKEDWRYILVAESGMMSITINLDTPTAIDGGWNIIDSEGRTLHRQSFSKTQGFYEFKDFPVKKGVYYFQTFATSGSSIYTIASSFRPNVVEVAVVMPEPEPEPEPVAVAPPRGPRTPREPRTTPAPTPTPAPAPAPAPSGAKVKGYISIITPRPDGSAEITIRDVGKNKGIEAGAVGVVEGTNMRIQTTQCFATSCRAIIPEGADPKRLKQGANVVF
ncbi:MAG: hypothetical protein FWC40_01305 [Proteobacteria bacterium]|nr:hypothetical protein [Pseudomonadota bacterium]